MKDGAPSKSNPKRHFPVAVIKNCCIFPSGIDIESKFNPLSLFCYAQIA
jgi:hypothetical protein